MAGSSSHITILTLNVNGLNAPIKRHKMTNWIKSQDPSVCCIQETHLTRRDIHRLKIKGWRKIYQANREQKKAAYAIVLAVLDFTERKAFASSIETRFNDGISLDELICSACSISSLSK